MKGWTCSGDQVGSGRWRSGKRICLGQRSVPVLSVDFVSYVAERTQNTICGRNPIQLLLQLLTHLSDKDGKEDYEFVFVRYEQSSKAETARDSSVSYVSGILRPRS